MQFNPKTKTIIFIGTGGVGKTTTAAAVAFGKAMEGYKVLVITIDPSKRLAQAMNFKPNGLVQKIPLGEKNSSGQKTKGSLHASTIDHEKVFFDFLKAGASKNSAQSDINKIQNNRLFKQLSTRLSQSQDFTTLFYLYHHVQSSQFDYVILDTPPAQHTWSFLQAPQKLATLFSDDITSWFRSSSEKSPSLFKKILHQGTLQALNALQMLTGSDFLNELKSFFDSVYVWQKPLKELVLNCQKLLIADTTEFVLVTSFDQNKFELTQSLSQKIYNEGYNLTHLIVNMTPEWLEEKSLSKDPTVESFRALYQNTLKQVSQKLSHLHRHLKVYKSFNLSQNMTHADLYKIYIQMRPMD